MTSNKNTSQQNIQIKKHQVVFTSALQNLNDAIVTTDLEYKILSVNKKAEKILNKQSHELISIDLNTFFKDQTIQEIVRNIFIQIEKDPYIVITKKLQFSINKKTIELETTFSGIQDNNEALVGYFIVLNPQKEIKINLDKLHRLDSIIRYSKDAIYSTTLDSTVITWNEAAEQIYGYTSNEMIGQKLIGLTIPTSHLKEFEEIRQRIMNGERVLPFETTRQTRNKKTINVYISASPLLDDKDNVTGMSVIAHDITEKKRMEKAYEESQLKYKYLSELSSDFGYEIKVPQGGKMEFTWITEAFNKITGYRNTRFGQFEKWVHPEYLKQVKDRLKILTNKLDTYDTLEYKIACKLGAVKWVSDTAVAIKNKKSKTIIIYGSVKDITEQKNLELRRDEFIGMASHELKTPLTTIKVFLDLMTEDNEKNAELVYFTSKIQQEVDRLVFLINNMLDVSKFHAKKIFLDMSPFEIEELINETVRLFQISNKTHQFKILNLVNQTVNADRFRIQQVLQNILSNAVKYSPATKVINISAKTEGKNVVVSVQDFGIGISKEHEEKIFERFYRVHGANEKTFSGLGIGLFICSEIIKQHKGKIWFESEKGQGTTFYFSLPINKKRN